MSFYSSSSKEKLDTCDAAIMRLFYKVDENYPHTIIYGYRTPEEQFEIYKKGRKKVGNVWLIDEESDIDIRTERDGTISLSDHNYYPSRAVDVLPDPVDWSNLYAINNFATYVKKVAFDLGINILWGGDWNGFVDMAHWYLRK